MKIAIPKGRLQAPVLEALSRIGSLGGIHFPDPRGYRGTSKIPGIEAVLIKPRAIPQLLQLGCFDIGFCGLDILREAGEPDVISAAEANGLVRIEELFRSTTHMVANGVSQFDEEIAEIARQMMDIPQEERGTR